MAYQGDEHDKPLGITVDEYGNPIRLDEYGNPIRRGVFETPFSPADLIRTTVPDTTDLISGLHHPGLTDVGIGSRGAPVQQEQLLVSVTTIQRTKSTSSSSSSEDDGLGGRRKKKGLKDRVKEQLPGGHQHEPTAVYAGREAGYAEPTVTAHHEKKGIMEKIKDKLHGHHQKDQHY